MSLPAPLPLLLALLLLAAPGTSLAESVDFEEMPAMDDASMSLTDEYAHLGLYFDSAGATWSGTEDDPGGWGLEGTAGPSFLGIDAPSYTMVMHFDWPVGALSFDIARSESGGDASVMVFGYGDDYGWVETVSKTFPDAVNDWVRVEMTEDVKIVVVLGIGWVPYGVDDIRWAGPLGDDPEASEEIEVAIDVLPGSDDNPIQVGRSGGVVPVVLFSTDGFDASEVDPTTLQFGPGMAVPVHDPHPVDHDGDGQMDLLLHMPVADSQIAADAIEACLVGSTPGGPFFGCDVVTPVGGGRARGN